MILQEGQRPAAVAPGSRPAHPATGLAVSPSWRPLPALGVMSGGQAAAKAEWRSWLVESWNAEIDSGGGTSSHSTAASNRGRRVDVGVAGATPRAVREYEPVVDQGQELCSECGCCCSCFVHGGGQQQPPVGARLCDMLLFGARPHPDGTT
eukprot:COSAG01_NODE_18007_length_1106_cov_1.475670_2_plen_151_part_00